MNLSGILDEHDIRILRAVEEAGGFSKVTFTTTGSDHKVELTWAGVERDYEPIWKVRAHLPSEIERDGA
ncbi:hypothetical protein [Pararhodobacter aggregans]|uniref:hypothetical protein n=1 Tax=Pararhodobacter aggregans TaxID=404875 RepID=UPI00105823A4|nr:hypothetical protein [Pararhodobacter aggregans]